MSFHPETEFYKYWTQEEEFKLGELVETGKYGFKDIGNILGRSASSCQTHSRVLGFNNHYVYRIYSHNEEFFKIPNLLNCYWAGFLAADGSVQNYGGGDSIKLEIADLDHLERFKNDVNFNGQTFTSKRENRIVRTKRVIINSRFWAHDLKENFGIIPNKVRRLTPPNLDDDLLKFLFFIGYIDGDGCFCTSDVRSIGKQEFSLSITSCSIQILESFKILIDQYFGDYKLRKKVRKINRHSASPDAGVLFCGGMQALMILNFFKDFPLPLLNRKWQNPKALEFLELKKQQYPNFFTLSPALQSIHNQVFIKQLPIT